MLIKCEKLKNMHLFKVIIFLKTFQIQRPIMCAGRGAMPQLPDANTKIRLPSLGEQIPLRHQIYSNSVGRLTQTHSFASIKV